MKLTIALLCLLFTGCASSPHTATKKGSPYAPVNEVNGGTVKYLDEGWKSVRAKRRLKAYKKMHDHCQGDYQIIREMVGGNQGAAVPIGGVMFYGTQREIEINFECVEKKIAEAL